MAWKEFEELKEENEQLRMLQFEAEKYAHQVRTEFPQMLLQIIGFATEAAQGKEAATAPNFSKTQSWISHKSVEKCKRGV